LRPFVSATPVAASSQTTARADGVPGQSADISKRYLFLIRL
jgi:hypothetical protein